MVCLKIDDIVSQWNANKIGILACFIAVLAFSYWLTLARWLATKLKPLLLRGIRRDSFDCGIEALNLEVKQMKSELDAISPTNQFAAYFKKERSLKKLLAELNSLTMEREKNSGMTSTLLLIFSRIFVLLIASLLMFYSRNVIIGYINPDYFWPLNFLLYIPNFSPPMNAHNNVEGTPITLFAFLSLFIFVWQTAYSRSDSDMKWKVL